MGIVSQVALVALLTKATRYFSITPKCFSVRATILSSLHETPYFTDKEDLARYARRSVANDCIAGEHRETLVAPKLKTVKRQGVCHSRE